MSGNPHTDTLLCLRNGGNVYPYVVWESILREEYGTIRLYYKCLQWSPKRERIQIRYIMDSHNPTFLIITTDNLDGFLKTKHPWRERTSDTG